ncbi:MAG TPA: glycosyltransferase family 4 protein, partial [Rhodocyclaceae bacterium]|nr:glycosyltransferase family 4 protein [Rhodocyclaceae bacterium]
RIPKGNIHCLRARGYLDPGAVANFIDHLRRVKPSVIVAANGYALMYASLARWASGLRVPLMVTYHTTQLMGAKEQVKMALDRPFFWNANRAVFVCHMQQRYWSRRLVRGRSNEVIYNGVDIEHFRDTWSGGQRLQLRRDLGISDEDYVIGISAVMRPEKNHVQLVDALGRLRDQGISACILMIGDGMTRPQIEARARQVGVADRIHITGLRQEVRPLISACDVMVLCSVGIETFSLAALEAMAMSRPVIHSNQGGAAEMITHEHNGLIFETHDTPGLVRCLAQLSDHTIAKRMGHQARRTVEARFSERTMVDRYELSLKELCDDGGRRARVASAA